MFNRGELEYALLLKVVQEQRFEILLKNDITIEHFSNMGKEMYKHIEDYLDKYNEYMHVNQLLKMFNIEPEFYTDLMNFGNTEFLIDTLKGSVASDEITNEVQLLNANSGLVNSQPMEFIKMFDETNERLKRVGMVKKSVNLLDDMDSILQLDRNNVIKTGFRELDDKLIGWNRGEDLIVLMGRPGQGKSFIGLNFSLSAALQGERVGIYSGEMSKEQVQRRMMMLNKRGRVMSDKESIEEMRRNQLNLSLVTQKELQGRATVRDLESMILKDELTYLFVDQLSLMDDYRPKVYDIRTRYSNISSDLFTLSTKFQIPIILAVQSNRDGGMQKDAPMLENIAESDAVGQNATRVIGMRRESNITTMNISKNRYGDDTFVQKYDTEFALGKFTPIMTTDAPMPVTGQSQTRRRTLGNSSFR